MSVTERLMGMGQWNLRLIPETPPSVLAQIDLKKYGFGHIVITSTEMSGSTSGQDARLPYARYTGVYRSRPSAFEMGGPGPAMWLADEDNKGEAPAPPHWAASPYGWAEWLPKLQPSSLGVGFRTAGGLVPGTYQKVFSFNTYREIIDDVCSRFGTEWRVRPDLALDLGRREDLFRMTPVAIVMRRAEDSGRDALSIGLTGSIEVDQDLDDWTREVLYFTGTEATPTIDSNNGGIPAADVPYRNPFGQAIIMTRQIKDFGSTPTADGPALAAMQYGRFDHAHEEMTLNSIEYDIGASVRVGDNVNVYDPERGIYDTANALHFRGQTIFPQVVRCVGHQWPIRSGMGVYFRRYEYAASLTTWPYEYIDLTPYVDWETGTTQLELGALPRGND